MRYGDEYMIIWDMLGKGSIEKKRFLSGIARIRGGVYPCPIFLALFLEVHFWSIKESISSKMPMY